MSTRAALAAAAVLDQFVAQHELPPSADAIDVAALEPHHRCLLVTDGTVTSLVRAYALEPVLTRRLEEVRRVPSAHERRWLSVEPDTVVLARRVEIDGAHSGTVYLRASSLLVPDRLPVSFLESLQRDGASIGSALVRGAVEHRRELLWCHRRPGTVASRTYRVFVRGLPALLISEDFLS